MKRFVMLFLMLFAFCFTQAYAAVELDGDSNGLVDVSKGGLNALPTADTQLLQATGVGTFGWTSVIDDTKGNGDTEYLWSADKVFDQVALKANITSPVFLTSVALPQAAAPTVDAAGEVAVDTTTDQFIYYGAAKRVMTYKRQKDFQLKAPVDGDDYLLFKAQTAMTITDIHAICVAGTSVAIDIKECDSAGANCASVDAPITADTNGAEDDGSFTNGTIDAGDWVQLSLAAPTGAVTHLTVSIYYVETAD